jgi:tRNA threonylcarbamoyladenosine biosynthesis protein TsaB
MIVLALDSSADLISVAVLDAGEMRAERSHRPRRPVSEGLLPVAEAVMAEAALSLDDVSLIAVATGPGSFNGIRGGIATAQGLALGLGVPAVGVPTLEAVAYHHAGRAPVILALLPAGRNEYYGATFTGDWDDWRRLSDDGVGPVAGFLAALPSGALLCGRLVGELRGQASQAGLRCVHAALEPPRAAVVGALAERRCRESGFDAAASLRPLYLRHPGITHPARPLSGVDATAATSASAEVSPSRSRLYSE